MNRPPESTAHHQTETGGSKLGLTSLVCLVIGNMIGVGVYVSSGYALSDLRDARYVLLVWLVAGIHAMCGAIAYAAVAKRFSVSGGEYAILSRWAHPCLGFVAGWVSIFAGFAAPIAAAALVFADYAQEVNSSDNSQSSSVQWLAMSVVVTAAIFHWMGIKWNAWVNNSVIAIKFVGIAVFITFGLRWILGGNGSDGVLPTTDPAAAIPNDFLWLALGSFFYTTLAYTGFNASIYLVGSLTNDTIPSTDDSSQKREALDGHDDPRSFQWNNVVAKSMILACAIVTILYLVLNSIFLYAIPADKLIGAGERFVGAVAIAIGGEWFGRLTSWLIVLSTGTSVLAMMMTGPHVYLQLARDLGWTHIVRDERTQTRIAILCQTLIACTIIMFSKLSDTISYLGLTLTACGGLAIASIWLAQFRGEFREKLKIHWWEHLSAATYVLGALALLVIAFLRPEQHMKFVWSMSTFLVGVAVYGFFRLFR